MREKCGFQQRFHNMKQSMPRSTAFFLTVSGQGAAELPAGFKAATPGDRGEHRRDFQDVGVNTRHAMEHVRGSKTGLSSLHARRSIGPGRLQQLTGVHVVCLHLNRDERQADWADGKLLPHGVVSSVAPLPVSRGFQPTHGVSPLARRTPLSARGLAGLGAQL